MSIETIGGREYYTKAVPQALTTSFSDVPANAKAILFPAADDYIWRYVNPDGSNTDISMLTAANQIVNIIPDKIAFDTSGSGTIYFLF